MCFLLELPCTKTAAQEGSVGPNVRRVTTACDKQVLASGPLKAQQLALQQLAAGLLGGQVALPARPIPRDQARAGRLWDPAAVGFHSHVQAAGGDVAHVTRCIEFPLV